jgi:biotin carboxyl carrier protein
MAKAYTPGLTVTSRTLHRVRRSLPIAGDVLVKVGDQVEAKQVVARTFTDGEITLANLMNALGVPAAEVPGLMLKKVGDAVSAGEVIARTKGIFGMMKRDAKAPVDGTIESISATTGQLILRGERQPVDVRAYMSGRVVEVLPHEGAVIENHVMFVQGIFGIGGEAFGPLRIATTSNSDRLDAAHVKEDMRGAVVIGGARMTAEALAKARDVGAAALVAGGIDDHDLKEFLGYDLGVAITGSERLGLTFIVTEGFGDIAMAQRTFELLKASEGKAASVNGATQIRAGVMRPEIIVALPAASDSTGASDAPRVETSNELALGTLVRVIRDPYFGQIGTVKSLPHEPRVLGSGSKARVLEVRLDSGDSVVVPRANVELIEG